MFPTQRMLSREDDPSAPMFPSDFFSNINSNKDEQVQGDHGVQPADIGLPTGNGKKLSNSQAQLGQAT